MELRPFLKEEELENLLAKSPDLLPAEEGQQQIVFFRQQVTLGQNAADLVGVDAQGGITIIECKLHSNPESRREVVGQILEYSAQLCGMEFEEFSAIMKPKSDDNGTLIDAVQGKAEPDWSEADFRSGVQKALADGQFRQVIAISGVNDELKGIVEYVNTHGRFQLEILELHTLCHGDDEMLTLETYAPDVKPPATLTFKGEMGKLVGDVPKRILKLLREEAEATGGSIREGDPAQIYLTIKFWGIAGLSAKAEQGALRLGFCATDAVGKALKDQATELFHNTFPGVDFRFWVTKDSELEEATRLVGRMRVFYENLHRLKQGQQVVDQGTSSAKS
jgi:hypothetical protein